MFDLFPKAMNSNSVPITLSLPYLFKGTFWPKYSTVADIGGSLGHVVGSIVKVNKNMKGVVCELP